MEHIFESHAHYDDPRFEEDREQVLLSLADHGVQYVVNVGASVRGSEASVALSERFDFVYAAVGVHPEDADVFDETDVQTLRRLAAHKKVVAIGEIGLDYHYDDSNKERQIAVFRRQMQLAKDLALPVIIHSRDACADTLEVLREFRLPGVLHCFSGSAETAKEIVSLGMYVGFTGVLTFKNARKAVESVAAVPMERILCETDSPYMAPEPVRGTRCDSSLLPYILAKMAEIKGVTPQEMADVTCENAKRLFRIL